MNNYLHRLMLLNIFVPGFQYAVAQGWERDCQLGEHEEAFGMTLASDGGYVIAACTDLSEPNSADVWLFKTDYAGQMQWSTVTGIPGGDFAADVVETSDGGFLVVGYAKKTPDGDYDVLLVKTNADGDTLGSRTFGGPNDDIAYRILSVNDGYIIVGYISYDYLNSHQAMMMKLDTHGELLWTREYGYSNTVEDAYSVTRTTDGGYLLAGTTEAFSNFRDGYIVKTDSAGNEQWSRHFGDMDFMELRDVASFPSGGYIVAGRKHSNDDHIDQMYYARLDELGYLQWEESPAEGMIASIVILPSHDIVMGGSFDVSSGDAQDPALIKVNENGELIWSRRHGKSKQDGIRSIEATPDGGYVGAGFQVSPSFWSTRAYLIKTDDLGRTDLLSTFEISSGSVSVYPNTFKDELNISIDASLFEQNDVALSVKLCDMQGRELLEAVMNDKKVTISRQDMAAGAYICCLLSKGRVIWQGKVIAE